MAETTSKPIYRIMDLHESDRPPYNLHQLSQLKWVMEVSLTKTLVKKLKTTRAQIYHRYRASLKTQQGTYRILQTTVDRGPNKTPLTDHFGGISLCWNKWVSVYDEFPSIWNRRSELVERLQAQKCELCGTTINIEVHHIRKLADLKQIG